MGRTITLSTRARTVIQAQAERNKHLIRTMPAAHDFRVWLRSVSAADNWRGCLDVQAPDDIEAAAAAKVKAKALHTTDPEAIWIAERVTQL